MAIKASDKIPSVTLKQLSSNGLQDLTTDKFKEQGIEVACLAVNDPFVMKAWSEAGNADGITMLADGNGIFTKALGLEMDGTAYGIGTRAQRFALYAENGVVKSIGVEKPGAFEVSSAEVMVGEQKA
jgi:peroxiredoxin